MYINKLKKGNADCSIIAISDYICVGRFFVQNLNLLKKQFMKIAAANKKLDAIIEKVEKEGITAAGLIEDLKELREFALKEADPLVTKVIRLSYEFLTEKEAFNVQAQYDEDEDGSEYPIEIEDKDNFLYLLNLLKNADHKINREEIKDYRTALKEELY
jgi:hypothetical protein